MPGKTKDTVEYFPFFVKDGRTLYVLQKKYGLHGIGFFTQLMRWLARSPGHYYVYVDDFDKDRLNEFCGLGETDLRAMIADMVKTGKIDKELWEERSVIFSVDFVDELAELYRRRKSEQPTREMVLSDTADILPTYCRHDADILTDTRPHIAKQRRVEKSRGEESKSAVPAEAPPPAKKTLSQMRNELAQKYQDRFVKIFPDTGWSDYAKERAQLITLAKKTKALLHQTPYKTEQDFIDAIMKAYLTLRKKGKGDYWRRAPIVPSALCTRWSEVITYLAETHEQEKLEVEEILF